MAMSAYIKKKTGRFKTTDNVSQNPRKSEQTNSKTLEEIRSKLKSMRKNKADPCSKWFFAKIRLINP